MLSGNLRQSVRQATGREVGGCLLSDDICNITGLPVAEVLQEKHPDTQYLTMENPTYAAFEEYIAT